MRNRALKLVTPTPFCGLDPVAQRQFLRGPATDMERRMDESQRRMQLLLDLQRQQQQEARESSERL